jgi:hypothetical protein
VSALIERCAAPASCASPLRRAQHGAVRAHHHVLQASRAPVSRRRPRPADWCSRTRRGERLLRQEKTWKLKFQNEGELERSERRARRPADGGCLLTPNPGASVQLLPADASAPAAAPRERVAGVHAAAHGDHARGARACQPASAGQGAIRPASAPHAPFTCVAAAGSSPRTSTTSGRCRRSKWYRSAAAAAVPARHCAQGWTAGPKADEQLKTHPSLVPYEVRLAAAPPTAASRPTRIFARAGAAGRGQGGQPRHRAGDAVGALPAWVHRGGQRSVLRWPAAHRAPPACAQKSAQPRPTDGEPSKLVARPRIASGATDDPRSAARHHAGAGAAAGVPGREHARLVGMCVAPSAPHGPQTAV